MDGQNSSQIDLLVSVTPENPGGFVKHWDTGSRHEPPAQNDLANHHQTILNLLVENRETNTSGFVEDLAQQVETISKETPTQSVQSDASVSRTILKLMNKIFDDFELFSTTFNETNTGSELFVNCTRPETRRATSDQTNSAGQVSYVDGYLATRNWSMLLRGTKSTIKVFVFPSEALLGFRSSTLGESDFPSLFEITRAKDENRRGWKIGDKWISQDQLPILSAQLFSDFVRLAAAEPTEADTPAEAVTPSVAPIEAQIPLESESSFAVEQNFAEQSFVDQNVTEAPPQVLLDPAVVEACKVMSIVVDQNLHRLLLQSKRAVEAKQFDQFYDIQQLIEKLGALKSYVGTTSDQITSVTR